MPSEPWRTLKGAQFGSFEKSWLKKEKKSSHLTEELQLSLRVAETDVTEQVVQGS